MRVLVTGGLGFIGSAVVRRLIESSDHHVINVDKVTYAATFDAVRAVVDSDRYTHLKVDICDRDALESAFDTHTPDAVIHLAAESHVDRSIDGPADFVQTNLVGTFNMLEAARRAGTRSFVHVSTDEVFGSLSLDAPAFTESTPYDPRSPYSASKAGSDHLARAWSETYGLPVVITNCSNNYGPFHFPEKLIPLVTIRALAGEALPVYGRGENIRDWLYVDDHARALILALETGSPGETYAVGGSAERTNLQVVEALCDQLDQVVPMLDSGPRQGLIEFVADRPGHDLRYAIDSSKIRTDLGWAPEVSFDEGLATTVQWYVENRDWWEPLVANRASERRGLAKR